MKYNNMSFVLRKSSILRALARRMRRLLSLTVLKTTTFLKLCLKKISLGPAFDKRPTTPLDANA